MAKAAEPAPDLPEVLVWTDAPRADLAERVVGLVADARVLAVGSPHRGDATALAERVGAEVYDDLRQMLVERPASSLLLTTAAGFKPDDIATALDASVDVVSIEPIAVAMDQALADRGEGGAGRLWPTPALRCCPAWLSAAEPQEALGRIGSLSITSVGPVAAASLAARLADALDTVLGLLGLPDQIDAALAGPLAEPPADLRGLTGHLTVNLHYADQAAATIHVSDRSAVHRRTLTAVGADATLMLDDQRYELYVHAETDMAADQPLDQSDTPAARHADPARLIAAQWRHLLQGRTPYTPYDRRAVIGCCETALLSVRTGQNESAEKLLRLGV